jgi:histidyl-tRNA synthetase
VKILATLRKEKISADMDYTKRKFKAMLEQADNLGARFALVLGDDELARGEIGVRDMKTKEQKSVLISDLAESLR